MVTTALRSPLRPLRHERGFSLVELMVVLMILGVIMGMAIETFPSMVNNQRARAASFDLNTNLSVARSEALKRGSNVSIEATDGSDWSNGWSVKLSGATLLSHEAPTGITITGSATSVTFNRSGRAASSPTFEIDVAAAPGDHLRCVRLDLSGSPRTSSGAC